MPHRLRALLVLPVIPLLLLSALPSATAADAPSWRWPVVGPRSVLRPFQAPPTPYAAGHRGLDIAAPDERLLAPASGTVRFAGVVVDRPVLSIDHGGGVVSSFEPVVALVSRGDAVERGETIGTIIPGHCSETCVHVGVRVDGQYVSPMAFFGGIPRAILLPTR
ncbi:murein hydrolase activator EnvC family protein [Salinibacterium soli]|uniref:Peptidoglycan DD-metalloendopeptidase family protein n=1 Tax=Antiquaquibacter soli TaxID=3064523 RepID=A0ABT9BN69_9MICO|nr:peptidoglycan DD-metalloendopeptidase family protein [Protaetiibacter sp. WY-16]MDO7882484.1 peptidoglycan DD-metalloendopeptidase family protein [Protaetiibacter sp. WY-16]